MTRDFFNMYIFNQHQHFSETLNMLGEQLFHQSLYQILLKIRKIKMKIVMYYTQREKQ